MITITEVQRQTFRESGYLIIRNAFSADRVQSLVNAVEQILDRARTGELRQSIKWIDKAGRIPAGINNMLHPDAYEPAIGPWFDAEIIPIVETMLKAPIRCSWLSLLASGGGQPYRTIWHRDYCDVGAPQEAAVLERDLRRQCSFQAPLKPGERFLQIVPGSHVRPSTEAEVAVCRDDPHGDMPGQVTIELAPGDIVYRHAHILHRGWNPEGVLRWTLLSGFWWENTPVWQEDADDREAMLTSGHLERMPGRLRAGIQRYLNAFPEGEPKSVKER